MSPPLITIDALADTMPCTAILHGPNGYTLGVISQESDSRMVFTRTSEAMYLTWVEAWDVALAEAASGREPEEDPDEEEIVVEEETFYRVHQADVAGVLVDIRWHSGLTFQVWAAREAEWVEVTAFTQDGVVASYEHACQIAQEWFETDGGRESVIELIAAEHPGLTS